jgi:hypothetical protein
MDRGIVGRTGASIILHNDTREMPFKKLESFEVRYHNDTDEPLLQSDHSLDFVALNISKKY